LAASVAIFSKMSLMNEFLRPAARQQAAASGLRRAADAVQALRGRT